MMNAPVQTPLPVDELRDIAQSWGFEQQAIDEVILSDRLLGTSSKVSRVNQLITPTALTCN